jgi:Ser/Thr protein kinase RdoA (MazF antagonist)
MSGTGAGVSPPGLVHGMGKDLVEPDWSPLTGDEVASVLSRYPSGTGDGVPDVAVTWHSPRPMSAAALVRRAGGEVFVKRHDPRVRTAAQLAAEHAFVAHLRKHGVPAPAVLRTRDGATTVCGGGFVYEVHEVAAGTDLYRDAVSWSPYRTLDHAHAAGAALARLHRAAEGFSRPARPQAVLISGCDVVTAGEPVTAVQAMIGGRPGLARYMRGRDWQHDVARDIVNYVKKAAPLLAGLGRQWGHGDWHPSNLTWTSADGRARVAGVFDFGLANRTFAVHDLATALERSTVAWLDLAGSGRAAADLGAIEALLDGYESVRPLIPAEAVALPEVLPVVHVEYALAEIEYFADVLRAPGLADLAYDAYLLGHARWFAGTEGRAVTAHLRRRAALRVR